MGMAAGAGGKGIVGGGGAGEAGSGIARARLPGRVHASTPGREPPVESVVIYLRAWGSSGPRTPTLTELVAVVKA